METAGAFEANTQLTALLDRVAQGERITITRDGVPAALLVPLAGATLRMPHSEIVAAMRALRGCVRPDSMSVAEMVADGRRS